MARSFGAKVGGRLAPQKANVFAEDIVTPLLKEKEENYPHSSPLQNQHQENTTSTESVEPSLCSDEDTPNFTATQLLKHFAVVLLTAGGAAASIASFVISPAIIVYVAGGVCLFNAPIVVYKEKKISIIPTMRNAINGVRKLGKKLHDQRESLEREIDALHFEAERFEEIKEELSDVAGKQGSNIDNIVALVKENEYILDAMRENIRQKVMQDVIAIVVKSDRDNDMQIDRVEAKLLALKISVKLEVYGIVFDEDKFMRAISLNPTIYGVISIVKKLLPGEDEVDDESILDEDDVYDMFYMSKEEQRRRGSVEAVRAEFQGVPGVSLCKNFRCTSLRRASSFSLLSVDA